MNIIKNQKGVVMLMTLFILSSILIVVLGAADLIIQGVRLNRNQAYSNLSYFAAETGAERVLYLLRKTPGFTLLNCSGGSCTAGQYIDFGAVPNNCCTSTYRDYPLPNGAVYYVVFNSASPYNFYSYGFYNGMQRKVELNF